MKTERSDVLLKIAYMCSKRVESESAWSQHTTNEDISAAVDEVVVLAQGGAEDHEIQVRIRELVKEMLGAPVWRDQVGERVFIALEELILSEVTDMVAIHNMITRESE